MYEWVKVIHLLAVISWMAGLFYLPRLFVYHSDCKPGGESDATFQVMERRLLMAIMRPAAAVTLASGLALLFVSGDGAWPVWLAVKLLAVVGMFGFHSLLEHHARRFVAGERTRNSRYFRIINEIPTVLLIIIVVMVVVRPFS